MVFLRKDSRSGLAEVEPMLYEFAVTPDVFDSSVLNPSAALCVIVNQILSGIEQNGLIANLHRDLWLKHVRADRLPHVTPAERDQIIATLELLDNRHRFVRHPKNPNGDPTCDPDWLATAELSNAQLPFHGIVLSQPLFATVASPGPNLLELSLVLNSQLWTGRKMTRRVVLSDADFRGNLAPTLRFARSVTIADPYLSPIPSARRRGESLRFIDLVADLLGNRNGVRVPGRIVLHANADSQNLSAQDVTNHLAIWKTELTALKAQFQHSFKISYWEKRFDSIDFHNRYILTDQCGIASQHSFKCQYRTTPALTTLSILDEDDRVAALGEFDPANPAYDFIDSYESN
jgi:hypothetical protein